MPITRENWMPLDSSSKTWAWPGSLHGRGRRTTTPPSSCCFPQSRPTPPTPRPSSPSKRRGCTLSGSFTSTITSIFTRGLEWSRPIRSTAASGRASSPNETRSRPRPLLPGGRITPKPEVNIRLWKRTFLD